MACYGFQGFYLRILVGHFPRISASFSHISLPLPCMPSILLVKASVKDLPGNSLPEDGASRGNAGLQDLWFGWRAFMSIVSDGSASMARPSLDLWATTSSSSVRKGADFYELYKEVRELSISHLCGGSV